MATARIRGSALSLDPQTPGSVPAGSVYFDSSNANALSQKDTNNTPVPLASASSSDRMVKVMQNLSGATIPAGKPVSKKANGSIAQADADGPTGTQTYCGITLAAINHNSTGQILLVGPNVAGVINGLNYAPGQTVFLSETGGYANSTAGFVGNSDSIIQIGIADCPGGNATSVATDIIMFPDVVIRP